MTSPTLGTPLLTHTALTKESMRLINGMIESGKYKILFDAIKGFRNGFVYGARIRFPHALVLNIVWSNAPYRIRAWRIFETTKRHSIALGCSGLMFSLLRSILAKLQGVVQPWHSAFAGFVVGFLFWGEQNPVTVQMSMYILSRILSGFFFILAEKHGWKISPKAFRIYSAVLWMIVMPMFMYHGDALQPSMQSSMHYVYQDNEEYSSWYDLLFVNKDKSS